MTKLEELLKKVRRLGFGKSIEVGAVEYFRIEAEYWLAHAKVQQRWLSRHRSETGAVPAASAASGTAARPATSVNAWFDGQS